MDDDEESMMLAPVTTEMNDAVGDGSGEEPIMCDFHGDGDEGDVATLTDSDTEWYSESGESDGEDEAEEVVMGEARRSRPPRLEDNPELSSTLGFAAERHIVLLAQRELASLLALPDDAFCLAIDPEEITADYYGSLCKRSVIRTLKMLREWAENTSHMARCVHEFCEGIEFGSAGEYLEHVNSLPLSSLVQSARRAFDTQICAAGLHLWMDVFYFLNELREACVMMPQL